MLAGHRILDAMMNYKSFDYCMQDLMALIDAITEVKSDTYVSVLDGRLLWYFYPKSNELIPKPIGFKPSCRISEPKDISEKPILIGSSNKEKINWVLGKLKEEL